MIERVGDHSCLAVAHGGPEVGHGDQAEVLGGQGEARGDRAVVRIVRDGLAGDHDDREGGHGSLWEEGGTADGQRTLPPSRAAEEEDPEPGSGTVADLQTVCEV